MKQPRCLSDRPNCKLTFHHVHLDALKKGKIGLCFKDGAYSPKQENLIDSIFKGQTLVKYHVHCGDPSTFVLFVTKNDSVFVDKRTANSLIKRNVLVYDPHHEKSTRFASVYKLNMEKF